MTLVIEALELDKKTNIAYSHREELEVLRSSAPMHIRVGRLADVCIREVKRKQEAAKAFADTVPKGGEHERQPES